MREKTYSSMNCCLVALGPGGTSVRRRPWPRPALSGEGKGLLCGSQPPVQVLEDSLPSSESLWAQLFLLKWRAVHFWVWISSIFSESLLTCALHTRGHPQTHGPLWWLCLHFTDGGTWSWGSRPGLCTALCVWAGPTPLTAFPCSALPVWFRPDIKHLGCTVWRHPAHSSLHGVHSSASTGCSEAARQAHAPNAC